MFGLVLLVLLVLSLGSSKACVHYLTLAVISPNALLSCKSVETARYRFKGIFNQVAFEKQTNWQFSYGAVTSKDGGRGRRELILIRSSMFVSQQMCHYFVKYIFFFWPLPPS